MLHVYLNATEPQRYTRHNREVSGMKRKHIIERQRAITNGVFKRAAYTLPFDCGIDTTLFCSSARTHSTNTKVLDPRYGNEPRATNHPNFFTYIFPRKRSSY